MARDRWGPGAWSGKCFHTGIVRKIKRKLCFYSSGFPLIWDLCKTSKCKSNRGFDKELGQRTKFCRGLNIGEFRICPILAQNIQTSLRWWPASRWIWVTARNVLTRVKLAPNLADIVKTVPAASSGNSAGRAKGSGPFGRNVSYLVPVRKWLFSPISLLDEKNYPRNIKYMPAAIFFVRLDL
jgi:hypothetical protein